MVSAAENYPWSSYRAKIGKEECEWLDFDECYLGLSDRQLAYKLFVEEGVFEEEHSFIQQVLERNQLTGNAAFIDEVERRLGVKVEHRKPGRSKK